jgi:hypothetical protein
MKEIAEISRRIPTGRPPWLSGVGTEEVLEAV